MTAEGRNELRIFANENNKQAFMPTILILLDELDRLEAEVRQANDDSARSMMVANQACQIVGDLRDTLRLCQNPLLWITHAIGGRTKGYEHIHDLMMSTPEQTALDDAGIALEAIKAVLPQPEDDIE